MFLFFIQPRKCPKTATNKNCSVPPTNLNFLVILPYTKKSQQINKSQIFEIFNFYTENVAIYQSRLRQVFDSLLQFLFFKSPYGERNLDPILCQIWPKIGGGVNCFICQFRNGPGTFQEFCGYFLNHISYFKIKTNYC